MVLIHLFRLISLINVTDGNLWTDKKKIDRALLILNGTKFSNDLIIWQNTKECHHCSWIRSRDKLGNVILNLTENVTKWFTTHHTCLVFVVRTVVPTVVCP